MLFVNLFVCRTKPASSAPLSAWRIRNCLRSRVVSLVYPVVHSRAEPPVGTTPAVMDILKGRLQASEGSHFKEEQEEQLKEYRRCA